LNIFLAAFGVLASFLELPPPQIGASIAVSLLASFLLSNHGTDKAATSASPTKPESPASDDIVDNKDFVSKNPKYLDAIRTLISTSGHECSQVTHLFPADARSPYGLKLKALCGPPDT
jgi:hypothetical protein